jgi:hypothetical protein
MILQDQSKNYMRAKSFMLHKLGLACFGAALPLPQQLQNTYPHGAPAGIPPRSETHITGKVLKDNGPENGSFFRQNCATASNT